MLDSCLSMLCVFKLSIKKRKKNRQVFLADNIWFLLFKLGLFRIPPPTVRVKKQLGPRGAFRELSSSHRLAKKKNTSGAFVLFFTVKVKSTRSDALLFKSLQRVRVKRAYPASAAMWVGSVRMFCMAINWLSVLITPQLFAVWSTVFRAPQNGGGCWKCFYSLITSRHGLVFQFQAMPFDVIKIKLLKLSCSFKFP